MIESQYDTASGEISFILTANRSLTRQQAWIFLGLAGVSMVAIAAACGLFGLWLVLPFTGAEWLLLVYAFRYSFKTAALQEVLTVSEHTVLLERGVHGPEHVYRFQRTWTALERIQPVHRGYPSRLALRSHGRQVEVGDFLAEAERESLFSELQKILR